MTNAPPTSAATIQIKSVFKYIREIHPPPFFKQILTSSTFVEEELIQSLKMYSEIKQTGHELLKRYGNNSADADFYRLQALLRQSISFYEAADKMHYRVSPLIFYYSFMNAAKAAIFVHDKTANLDRIQHGLSASQYSNRLNSNKIKLRQGGVFPLLFKVVTGSNSPHDTELRLADLFGYITDVRYEHMLLRLGEPRNAGCRYANVLFHGENGVRGLIVIEPTTPKFFKSVSRVLVKNFTQIKIAKLTHKVFLD